MQNRTLIRTMAGLPPGSAVPIVTVPGDRFPTLCGEPAYHTTLSGKTIVRYPKSYGWRTRYVCSTERVEIGETFPLEDWQLDETDGVRAAICPTRATGYLDVSAVPYRGTSSSGWLCRRGGRTFHAIACSARNAILGAIAAWEMQDQARIASLSGWSPRAVPVTLYASELAGNCRAGSIAFARQHRLPLRGAPAALVLALAPDNARARGAITKAAQLLDSIPCI